MYVTVPGIEQTLKVILGCVVHALGGTLQMFTLLRLFCGSTQAFAAVLSSCHVMQVQHSGQQI